MARISIDDELHAEKEFKRLVRIVGNEDTAIGMLYRFWRQAQEYWANGSQLMPMAEFAADGFAPILESGMARETPDGVYALGARERFEWYAQRCEAASAGGRARAAGPRDTKGRLLPKTTSAPADIQPTSSRALDNVQPESSPSLRTSSLLSAIVIDPASIDRCKAAWLDTLDWAGQRRGLTRPEEETIARAIRVHGTDFVELALIGARHEPSHDGWSPKDHVDIARVLLPDKENRPRIQKFIGWGSAAKAKREREEATRRARDIAITGGPGEPEFSDPARVREILAASGFGRKP